MIFRRMFNEQIDLLIYRNIIFIWFQIFFSYIYKYLINMFHKKLLVIKSESYT